VVAESECLFVIKSKLNLVLVASESELCTRGNNTSHIFNYLYTPTLSGKSVCGDLLTCIPLFIAFVFEVPLKKKEKKRKKDKKRISVKKRKKKKQGANLLRLFFPSVRSGAL
jgi:hypothetical protein